MYKQLARPIYPLMLSVTLGLAPFRPEPHIVGKLRWIMGGGTGMQPLDWFDVLLHGFPWVWLLVTVILAIRKKF